jgi:hypothetical protein
MRDLQNFLPRFSAGRTSINIKTTFKNIFSQLCKKSPRATLARQKLDESRRFRFGSRFKTMRRTTSFDRETIPACRGLIHLDVGQ